MQVDPITGNQAPMQNPPPARQAVAQNTKMTPAEKIATGACISIFGGLFFNSAMTIAHKSSASRYYDTYGGDAVYVNVHKEPFNDTDMCALKIFGSITLLGLGMVCSGVYDYCFD